mmetsp:Transcript_29648/g.42334  ORF Transcript_29648/g.42334 Transcript_29648/m.42334 type:complete len:146 (+) Transcript_29648:23-460(+)
MYVLAVIEDKLTTIPEFFDRQRSEVLIEQIEVKYSNKVILDVGLCICFYDFLQVGDAYIYPSEGSAIQEVKFRVVIFRPFVGGRLQIINNGSKQDINTVFNKRRSDYWEDSGINSRWITCIVKFFRRCADTADDDARSLRICTFH